MVFCLLSTAASTSITLSSAGIPVGIAIARQRYVANSESVVNKQTTTSYKDTGNASCSAAAVVAPSSSASYSSVIPCHSTILSSGFAATPLGTMRRIGFYYNCAPFLPLCLRYGLQE